MLLNNGESLGGVVVATVLLPNHRIGIFCILQSAFLRKALFGFILLRVFSWGHIDAVWPVVLEFGIPLITCGRNVF